MASSEPGTRLIRIASDLLDHFGTRTDSGQRLTAEWGEPTATCGVEPGLTLDIYEPTFTVSGDTEAERMAEAARSERERLRVAVEGLRMRESKTDFASGANFAVGAVLALLPDAP